MSLYAIGDFHLSFTVNKPMDVFDKRWKNHVVKIEKYWKKRVTENDTVVITGDHSWGRDLAECQADLDFIMALSFMQKSISLNATASSSESPPTASNADFFTIMQAAVTAL